MLVEVKVPVFSESVSEGTLLTWHKKPGEKVSRGDLLIDIETDKVVLEVTALQDGVLSEVRKGEGEIVTSEEVVGVIDTEATAGAAAPAAQAPDAQAAQPAQAHAAPVEGLSPAVRKMVAETGVNPADVAGSGKGGRVTKGDVIAHLEGGAPAAAASEAKAVPSAPTAPSGVPVTLPAGERPEQRVPMTRIRARIAERLKEAQNTAAILTTYNEVNMQPVMDLRKRYQDEFVKKHGIKLGFMSFFVRAAVEALKAYPIINASVEGKDIIYHGYFDIGIAVASERGLVVPIIRDADGKSLAQIEKEIGEYAAKARAGKLTLEDMTGGTFSITNGGTFGSMMSTPILNQPQSAILGMHNIYERAVVENGQIVARPMMYLALSYDHRIIDGREAVLFLVGIKKALEDPARLLLDL
ncbi:2-oxoglutarate dehydrogenase E2 component (dihydrolipoamide succinyltransferase) [Deinobacterium chartae]|uniref:Dihydrolipoyllysine-residue succinyltransferase component of 2-oxoglutarate dehydrogenase complex n=1 Tax=Deinobacterium chartae TaxID=521158 RepID=A0A841HZW1_9DEIO|nr:2-oxoglutarate dehydrogenase complex dihydrolipoyllysine-residue succinyltransferase [Deinobacterium chartae]MBB6097740.1 2-oxoglutarate dehydrogenase E2 component (dihydrolipoamide succinyltransferase) [Deinobacterium chartae]